MDTTKLPTTLPSETTPKTYSANKLRTFIVSAQATTLIVNGTITNTAVVNANATTALLSADVNSFVPTGTTLLFGTIPVITTADVTIGTGATTVNIQAAPAGGLAANATATYSNLLEIPTPEEVSPTLTADEETIKVHGRTTPIRSVNGIDMTANIRTLAAIDDPVVRRLVGKGMSLSPNNRERLLWLYDDGFALMGTVNIGAPNRQAAPGGTQRCMFTANLSGGLHWANLNDTTPVWKAVNA
ncbi:hypothetical protein GO986_18675 [Deinococcus sp. HMF7620]|uniref:Uncharacterized protein n=1 Tax=Deinococcus arboris TaxID=2682977 RepID=A0A7C9HU58_9DEIO|nr:hypothetical protein [Deinococcus arboris]MVN88767.1 hypothetical protein [Deinococcus arboris]